MRHLLEWIPGNPKVIGGLLRCLVQLKKYDDAKEMMESLDDETLKDEEILKINKLLSNLRKMKTVAT
jgi:pentatricopeptide repeat protein